MTAKSSLDETQSIENIAAGLGEEREACRAWGLSGDSIDTSTYHVCNTALEHVKKMELLSKILLVKQCDTRVGDQLRQIIDRSNGVPRLAIQILDDFLLDIERIVGLDSVLVLSSYGCLDGGVYPRSPGQRAAADDSFCNAMRYY